MTSAENNVSEPPNLKIFWGRTLRPSLKSRAFGTCNNAPPPRYKKPSYGPGGGYAVTLLVISETACCLVGQERMSLSQLS